MEGKAHELVGECGEDVPLQQGRGWDKFPHPWNFAWFFVFTAFANEFVRLTFHDEQVYNLLGMETNGIGIWIAFKVALIMPLSAAYAWYLTRLMQRYRIPEGKHVPVLVASSTPSNLGASGAIGPRAFASAPALGLGPDEGPAATRLQARARPSSDNAVNPLPSRASPRRLNRDRRRPPLAVRP